MLLRQCSIALSISLLDRTETSFAADRPPCAFLCHALLRCPLHSYSALFVDEDPDVRLGQKHRYESRKGGVSVTDSGHVRLNQKSPRGRRSGDDERRDAGEWGHWVGSSSDGDVEEPGEESRSPGKVRKLPSV